MAGVYSFWEIAAIVVVVVVVFLLKIKKLKE